MIICLLRTVTWDSSGVRTAYRLEKQDGAGIFLFATTSGLALESSEHLVC
jgi:hypothetical protein